MCIGKRAWRVAGVDQRNLRQAQATLINTGSELVKPPVMAGDRPTVDLRRKGIRGQDRRGAVDDKAGGMALRHAHEFIDFARFNRRTHFG